MSNENPIAFSVEIVFEWPDNPATSEFVGLFRTFAEAKAEAEKIAAIRGVEEFAEDTEDTWTEGVGNWFEIHNVYPDGSLCASVLPVTAGDEWTKAFNLEAKPA